MKKVWSAFVLIASISNGVGIIHLWSAGGEADWFVWGSAVLFCIGVALDAIGDLIGVEQ